MVVDPVSLLGLVGLFNTCIEGYKICVAAKATDEDAVLLRTRMFLERERFLNWGRVCGFLPHHERDRRKTMFKKFVEEDRLRQQNMAQVLETIGSLLEKAEKLDKKYCSGESTPDMASEKRSYAFQKALTESVQYVQTSLRKVRWSIRDKQDYKELLDHLCGFNGSLEHLLPMGLQQLTITALSVTVCATNEEPALPELAEVSVSHPFLLSQIRWACQVHDPSGVAQAKLLNDTSIVALKDHGKSKVTASDKASRNRYTATCTEAIPHQRVLVDWHPWYKMSGEVTKRARQTAGLLTHTKPEELRLLNCLGYLENIDGQDRVRHALVYKLPSSQAFGDEAYGGFEKIKCLGDLLRDQTRVWPPLETRFQLARSLCRAMLLYHSSDWTHHDFRSDNIVFMVHPPLTRPSSQDEYSGCMLNEPYIIGFGLARYEEDASLSFEDRKTADELLKKQRLYWSPAYIAGSKQRRTARAFQRSHDIYALGCVLLELGVWQPLERYTWKSEYTEDHRKWHKRLLQEENKLKATCGTRYAEAVMNCLTWGTSDAITDVQMLCFDVLQKLEELSV